MDLSGTFFGGESTKHELSEQENHPLRSAAEYLKAATELYAAGQQDQELLGSKEALKRALWYASAALEREVSSATYELRAAIKEALGDLSGAAGDRKQAENLDRNWDRNDEFDLF